MTKNTDIRKLALALADVEEKSHFGSPSFRRNGKIFVQIGETNEAIFKLSPTLQEARFDSRPDAFRPEVWGTIRWARLMLDHIAPGELPDLVREAYDQVAPKTKTPAKKPASRKPSVKKKR